MDLIQKIAFGCTIVGWIGYKCIHNSIFLLLFAVSASVIFLRDVKKEESHLFFNLVMVGLIIACAIKVLLF